MNRKIKFRGKRVNGGEWVYGNLLCVKEHTCYYIGQSFTPTSSYSDEVIADTVGQFTGLHDKNGKEIYEGDILRIDYLQEPQYVYYVSDGFVCGAIRSINYPLHQVYRDGCIIGNIHDTPELLKVE